MDYSIDQSVEIKARCRDRERIRLLLMESEAVFRWEHEQSDIFYNVPRGRLKLRRCGDTSLLIAYSRPDVAGPKLSRLDLCPVGDPESLDRVLRSTLGVRTIVRKLRALYTHENVRIHLDRVNGLGDFVEIEVLGKSGRDNVRELRAVCGHWMEKLGIEPVDLVDCAYADLPERDSSS